MIDSHELKRRDSYLNKLIGFQDTEPVKVITGIRRCGKSSLLKLMVQHLKDTGIQPEQIIEMNFESMDFRRMTVEELYRYVKERLPETFLDFAPYLDGCRFVGCSHTKEKGCAVLEAVRAGKLSSSRHASYLRLYNELKDLREWSSK